MANVKINMELSVGLFSEVLLELEVEWSYTIAGEVSIDDFYGYHVETDNTGHKSFERIPYWLHKLVALELEEYHDQLIDGT